MIMRALNFAFLFALVVAGCVYPLLPQNNVEYVFAGTGSVISVSQETELHLASDRTYGLKINGEFIKGIAIDEGPYFYVTLKPGQKMEITGSPLNQNVYVAYHDDIFEKEGRLTVTVTSYYWAHAMAHPAFPGAVVVLIFGLLLVLPVKVGGIWLNLWLAWRFKVANAEKYGEGMTKAGAAFVTAACQGFAKETEVMLLPLVTWTATCVSLLAYGFLVFVFRLIFTGL